VAGVAEDVYGRESGLACRAHDGRVVAAEVPAPVEVGEGNVGISGRWHGRVGGLLIGQRLISHRLDGIGTENNAAARAAAPGLPWLPRCLLPSRPRARPRP